MIGGISYFHEFAYDLLAENERILASTFDARDRRASRRAPGSGSSSCQLVDGLRVGDRLPDARGRPADLAAADLDVRLPEARVRVLRQGRAGSSTSCRTRSSGRSTASASASAGPCATRTSCRGNVKLALSARRPGPRAEGAQGPGPAAHPRRRAPGPALHVRRRPRPRDPPRDGVGRGRQRRLQPLDRGVDDRARAGRAHLAQDPRPTAAPFRYVCDPPFEHDVQLRVPDVRKAREVLGFEATTTLDTMLDEVIPWIRDEVEAGRL